MSGTATLQTSAPQSGRTPGNTEGSVDVAAALSQSSRIRVREVSADRRRPSQKPHRAERNGRAFKASRKTPEQRALAALERRRQELRLRLGDDVADFIRQLNESDVAAAHAVSQEAGVSFEFFTQRKRGKTLPAAKALEVIGRQLDRAEAAAKQHSTIHQA